MYLGGTMKVIRRKIVGGVLAAVAASGLVFATAAPAAAHVAPHRHCLYTPNGWVPIAGGVSDKAPNLALEKFHVHVHTSVGVGADGVPGTSDDTIRRIGTNQDCSILEGQSPG
jgi:hypothetical protein